MSITSKWVGLGSYDLRLFLIKNRFFMTGDGIEANTKKLLALGFREVPKSAMKEGSRSYWSVPNEGDFLRRLVTAFPDYTVEMLPPEGINPTILVNRTRTLKGGNQNDAQQPRQRASNTGQPVVETPVRDLHAEPHAEPAVLVESGPQHDSGAESGNDAGDGARENVPPVVERDAGELRASGGDVPAAVETAQSSDGDSNVRRASELEQSSQDGQSGSANSVAGAELGASDADGARGRLLLDIDAVRIQSAMNRRVSLVDRVSDDSAELSQHVAKALEDGVYTRHEEFRQAYTSLEQQEQQLSLSQLFYSADHVDGVAGVVASLVKASSGDAYTTVGEAKSAFDSAGYGWLAEHIEPVLSFSDDPLQDTISLIRVKQIAADQLAIEAGVTGSATALAVDEKELAAKIVRAEMLAGLMALERMGRDQAAQLEAEVEQSVSADGVSDSAEADMMVDYRIFDKANQVRSAGISDLVRRVDSLKDSVDSAVAANDYSNELEFNALHNELYLEHVQLRIENQFFAVADDEGVAKVFNAFGDAQDIALDEAKAAFDSAGYGALYDQAMQMHFLFDPRSIASISVDNLKMRVVDRVVSLSGFDDTTDAAERDEAMFMDSLEDLAEVGAGILSLKEAAANAQSDQAIDPMLAEYAFFDMAYSAREKAVQKFYSEVSGLHRAVLRSLGLGDPSSELQEFEAEHDELNRAVPDLKFENIFFERAAGQGVTKVFDAFKVDQDIALDEAKAAFDAAGYGALYENAMSVNEASNSQVTAISYSDLKLKIVDGIERMEIAYMNENNPFRGRDDQFELDYYVALDLLDDISSNIAQLRSEVEAIADSEVDFDDNENDEVDEPHYQAAVFLFREQRQSVGNRAEDDDVRRRTKELAAVTSVNHVRTIMVLDMIATRMDMESLQFAEDLEAAASAVDDDAQWMVQRVADDASNFTLAEYAELATVTKLENHGRKWDVRYGSDSGFSDAEDEAGAIADRHRGAVNNALYYNSPENPNPLKMPLPRAEVLAQYPDLITQFPTAFIVDRPEAVTAVTGHSVTYSVLGYDIIEYVNSSSGEPVQTFSVQTDKGQSQAQGSDYSIDNNEIAYSLDAAVAIAVRQHNSLATQVEASEADSNRVTVKSAQKASVGDIVMTADGYEFVILNDHAGTLQAGPIVNGIALDGMEDLITFQLTGEEGEFVDRDYRALFHVDRNYYRERQALEQESNANSQEQAGSAAEETSIVARLAALGYEVDVNALAPFEGVSETYRQLLAKTEVVVTGRELYDGFDAARAGADTQTLIMNAPRPLVGHSTFEADFFAGRYYALVNTAGDNAEFQVENNVKMDATLPVYMDQVTHFAFSLSSNRYSSQYLDMLESGTDFESVFSEVVRHKGYTIETLEAALSDFKASFAGAEEASLEQEPVISDEQRLKDLPSNYTLADFLSAGSAAKETVEHPWKITNGSFVGSVSVASDEQQALAIAHRISVRDALYLNSPDSENNLNVPIPRNEVLLDYPDHVNDFSDVFLVDRPDVAVEAMADNAQLLAAYNVYGYDLYELNVPDATSDTNIYYILQTHANSVNGQSTVLADADSLTDTQLRSVLASARRQYIRASTQDLDAGADEAVQPQTDDSNDRPLEGERVTPDSALRSKAGDIVRTEDGREFMMLRARQEFTEAYEIIDGKTQVSADTGVMFHLNPDSAGSYTQRDNSVLFHTGRNYHEEQRDALAAEQAQNEQPTSEDLGELGGSASSAPVAFNSDDDTGVDVREWAGLTLDNLKNAEEVGGRKNFAGSVHSLNLLEQGTAIGSMQERHKNSLLQFTGWGGIYDEYRVDKRSNYNGLSVSKSLGMDAKDFNKIILENRLESYYTPASLIESMWKGVQRAGVPASGRYLEAGCGSGHFFVGAPADVQATGTLVGIECDPIAARFARAVAPDARIIEDRYENVVLDNNYDAVIGNVPFGSTKISDTRYPTAHYIHDYFIKRSLSHLKDGGLMAVITSAGTMDKADDSVRLDIMDSADLVAGVRLPSNTFGRDNAQVVTDILVFQKRPKGTEPSYNFTATQMLDVDDEKFRVNSFFVDNPQYVLGSTGTSSGPFGPRYDVIGGDLSTLSERVDLALNAQVEESLVQNATWKKAKVEQEQQVPAWDEDSYVVDDEELAGRMIGEIFISGDKLVEIVGTRTNFDSEGVRTSDSVLVADVVTTKARENILMSYVPLRDAAIALSKAQLSGEDSDIEWQQKETLKLYEGFVAKHGPANSRTVILAIQDDPLSSEVVALEVYNEDKKEVTRLAETLTKKVVGNADSSSVETAQDAFYVCIDRKGSVDFNYMAEISGLDQQTMKDELLGDLVYLNPKTHEIEQASSYLSGNVVKKLEEAEQAAMIDPQTYAANIAALNRVRPLLLPFEDISINLGASWVPADDIREFILNTCSKRDAGIRDVSVTYSQATGSWKVNTSGTFDKNNEIIMRSRFGTDRAKFTGLLELSLNGKKANHTYKDSEGKTHFDFEATMASRAKQEDIAEAFTAWTAATEERKEKLASIYNEKINVICPPKADGSRITFPGMSAAWKPRSHQSDIVAMGMMGQNIMAAHPVGSGKTFEMVALGMKLKGTGMATKPMIAVPNHMLAQMAREAKEIFPSAKVLMVTNDDLRFEKRKRFFAVARNNDWDLIVCTHSMLDRLKAPIDIRVQVIQDEIDIARRQMDEIEGESGKRRITAKIATLESKLAVVIKGHEEAKGDPKKAPMELADIGVDTLLVDEAHLYKNLFLNTSMQVLGISSGGSDRATNLLEISQYLRELHGKATGLHFFTGTPIANSIAELYVHNRFLRPDILEGMGINTFDQWALNFGKTVDKAEVLADGSSIGVRTRFSEFQNLPELIKIFRTFADVRTLAELNLPTPKLNSYTHIIPQTQLGKDHMIHLAIRAVAARDSGNDPTKDNILKIIGDGRKAALDLQMVDPRLPDDASLKLQEVANNVFKHWEETHEVRGAQLAFMDMGTPKAGLDENGNKFFSGYEKLRSLLVEKGMPKEQIAFIHDAKNDTQKETMFRAVRNGDIRLLIGSTLKMGVGTNVQERLCALHNVDAPWRPDQLEQRIGRIMRQGNLFFDVVAEHRYVTQDSTEILMYDKLGTKDRFIKQAMSSPDTADRVATEEVDAGYADVMAAATGEPRIREKFEVDADVERLERRERTWVREQAYVRRSMDSMKREIQTERSHIDSYKAVQQALPKSTYQAITVRGSVFGVQEGDTTWLSATSAGVALITRIDSVAATISRTNERSQPLKANVGGVELMLERSAINQDIVFADLDGRSVPAFSIKSFKNPETVGRSVRSLYRAAGAIIESQKKIAVIEDNIARSPAVQAEWPQAEAYADLRKKKQELDEWFVKQDFDSRFAGIEDPFLLQLAKYADQHAQADASVESDMDGEIEDLFGDDDIERFDPNATDALGDDMSQADIDDDLDLGHEDYDVGVEGSDEAFDDKSPRAVASRGASMGN